MLALFGLLTIVVLSILFVKIGTTALELTGLSSEVASFQAQSAFYGAGYTTSEAEAIVSHAVRRRIISTLILIGNVGFTSSVATLILTFVGQSKKDIIFRVIFLVIGLLTILFLTRSRYINKMLKRIITKALEKNTNLQIHDYVQILGLSKGYTIARLVVKADSWMRDRKLKELQLNLEGMLILSIYRMVKKKEEFIGAPNGETMIKVGDILICYAREDEIISISQRCGGCDGDSDHAYCMERETRRQKIRELQRGFE